MKPSSRFKSTRIALIAALLVVTAPATSSALGVIETPDPEARNSLDRETGIGLISGWHCDGEVIQIQIDRGERMTAASGTPRGDTRSVCGRTDTGFGLLFNFNRLGQFVPHELVAFADGVEFARETFLTTNFGVRYLRGKNGTCELLNFPEIGRSTRITWRESQQNFSISGVSEAPALAGEYFGASTYNDCIEESGPRFGTFVVDASGDRLTVLAKYADGRVCGMSGFMNPVLPTGEVVVDPDTDDCFGGDFSFTIDGERISGRDFIPCASSKLVAIKRQPRSTP